jgi:tetratricopeptide (TPR) repeat protein
VFGYSGYQRRDWFDRKTEYTRDWVQSQRFLQHGQIDMAVCVTHPDQLNRRKDWKRLPFHNQYWNDMGLLFELNGNDTEAASCYAQIDQKEKTRGPWEFFVCPESGSFRSPAIADLPSSRVPYFATLDGSYYAGSPFAYLAAAYQDFANRPDPTKKEQIIEVIESIEARGIRSDFCHALRGRMALLEGDYRTARIELSAAQTLFEARGMSDEGTLLFLGLAESALGNHDRATALLAGFPHNPSALCGLGVTLARRNRVHEALQVLTRALDMDPTSASLWFNRGMVYLQNGQRDRAEHDFLRASEMDPGNDQITRGLKMCDDLRVAQTLDPASGEEYLRQGRLLYEAGAYEEAKSSLLKAFELQPELHGEISGLLQVIAKYLHE